MSLMWAPKKKKTKEEVKRLGKTVLGMRTCKAKANCDLLFKVNQCIWFIRPVVLFRILCVAVQTGYVG